MRDIKFRAWYKAEHCFIPANWYEVIGNIYESPELVAVAG